MTGMAWLTKLLEWIGGWFSRRARIRGLLRRLRIELNKAFDFSRTYLDTTERGEENTPSYRCPADAYDKGIDLLAGRGIFDSDGLDKIMSAYTDIGDFNRCLEFVHEAVDTPRFGDQVARARVKAGNVQMSVPLAVEVVGEALARYE